MTLATMAASQTTLPSEAVTRAAWKAGVLGAVNMLAMVLAARLIVLVAVAGAISLTWLALQQPEPMRLGALAIYCVAVVIPTVFLALRGR